MMHERTKAEKLKPRSLAVSAAASLKFFGTRRITAVGSPSAR